MLSTNQIGWDIEFYLLPPECVAREFLCEISAPPFPENTTVSIKPQHAQMQPFSYLSLSFLRTIRYILSCRPLNSSGSHCVYIFVLVDVGHDG